jgi:hypothetical protein
MGRSTYREREEIRKLNQTVRRCNRNWRRPECLRLPQDENGKYYNPLTNKTGNDGTGSQDEVEDIKVEDYSNSSNETNDDTRDIENNTNLIDRDIIDRDLVITRDLPVDQDYIDENYKNISTKVFNGFVPVTEIQTITKTTSATTTLVSNFDLTPNQIANTPSPDNDGTPLNGWILLVGILAGTVVVVTLVWNSLKLWCRKCERDSMRRPPTITYLTQDQALTTTGQGQNRLAEVPVESVHTFQIETQALCGQSRNPENETFLTNMELNRMVIANINYDSPLPTELVPLPPPGPAAQGTSTPSEPPTYQETIERDETQSQLNRPDNQNNQEGSTTGNVTISTEIDENNQEQRLDAPNSNSDSKSETSQVTIENNEQANVHNV